MKNLFNIKTPSNLYLWWNFGSLLSLMMIIQILIGFMLSMNYISNNMFYNSMNIYLNMNYGWMMRLLHSNMTSMIFIIMMIHIKRNIIFKSFIYKNMWMTGMLMLLLIMMESFLGYSLICNQMSYWAMMVITNFISSIPYLGNFIMLWIWGNFNINMILINRFFSMHFLIPFMIMMMMLIHLMILHMNKSNNPLGINNKLDLIKLNPLFLIKDMYLFMMILMLLMNIIFFNPFIFNNNDNFNIMNYFKTPFHIEPEWYFLFFYSILRSINNKMNGLMILIISIIMLFMIPILDKNKMQNFNYLNKLNYIILLNMILFISMLSKKNIEYPYMYINKTLIICYFFTFSMIYMNNYMWNKNF